jgi:hypothetical protein
MGRATLWRDAVRGVPHYLERIAAGVMGGEGLLSMAEREQIGQRRTLIGRMRRGRATARETSPPDRRTGWHPLCRYRCGAVLMGRVAYTGCGGARMLIEYEIQRRDGTMSGAYSSRRQALKRYAEQRMIGRSTRAERIGRRYWRVVPGTRRGPRNYIQYQGRLTRQAVAKQIRDRRASELMRMSRLQDGGLDGWKVLRTDHCGVLYSPQQGTEWAGPSLVAQAWDESAVYRGTCGCHAMWPVRGGTLASTRTLTSHRYEGCAPTEATCYARVAGYGRYVAGEDGWRSEQQVLQAVYAPPQYRDAIARRYPDVPVYPY